MIKLILSTLLVWCLVIDATLYFTRTKDVNDCLVVYTKGWYDKGFLYKFDWSDYHIQADDEKALEKFKVLYSDWCVMYSDTITSSLFNTQACYFFKIFNKI